MGGETQVLVHSRGPHEPLGSGTAAAVDFDGRLWAWSFVAMRRCCTRPLVVWAAPDEDVPEQGDHIATSTYLGSTPDSYS